MQSQQDKLDRFMEAINSYAEKQRLRILYEMEQYSSAELDKAEKEALRDAYIHIQKETAEVRASVVRRLSAAELEGRRRLFEERAAIEDEVFATAAKRLAAFAATPEYEDYLARAAAKAVTTLGEGELTVRVRPADEGRAELFARLMPGCRIESDSTIRLGGFTAVSETRGVCVDMTLDARLADRREAFRRRCELMIED